MSVTIKQIAVVAGVSRGTVAVSYTHLNMFLGNERGRKIRVDWDETYNKADELLQMVGLKESSRTLIKDIGVGKQQLVEIAKALAKNVRLLILDEPTASLNETDSQKLLDLMIQFKQQGMTCIIISHKLNEVSYVADKITIIRDGSTIETLVKGVDDFSEERIIKGLSLIHIWNISCPAAMKTSSCANAVSAPLKHIRAIRSICRRFRRLKSSVTCL